MNVPETLKQGTSSRGIWIKGYEAAKAGKMQEACPYIPTSMFRRTFRKRWLEGWDEGRSTKIN